MKWLSFAPSGARAWRSKWTLTVSQCGCPSLPLSDIRALVWEKSHWIEAKLKRAAEKRQAVAAAAEKSARLGQGSPVLYQGRQLTLTLQQAEQTRIYQQAHELIVEAPGAMSGEPDQLRAIVEQWLYARAVEELHLCVNVYKQRVGAIPSRVEVKSYKARWGSCKPDQYSAKLAPYSRAYAHHGLRGRS